jgi:hypothetical protein
VVFAVALVAGLTVAPAASALARVRVYESTTTPIAGFALDGYGHVAWVSRALPPRYLERIHWGVLAEGSNVALTGRVEDLLVDSTLHVPFGPQDIAYSKLAGSAGPKVIWRQAGGGLTEADWKLLATASGRRAVTLGSWTAYGTGDSGLGPIAARDGTILYTVVQFTDQGGCCCDISCLRVTGGSIRRLTGGRASAVVPGAPAAAELVTAAGRLAEQTFTSGGNPSNTIEIRGAVTGNLGATISLPGKFHAMAMSQRELAVLVRNASGPRLVRYDASTGALLGSTPLPARVDPTTLGISGKRIVFQRRGAVEVYRIDLGRTLIVHRQVRIHSNLAIDRYGIRWLRSNHRGGSDIVGISLPRVP